MITELIIAIFITVLIVLIQAFQIQDMKRRIDDLCSKSSYLKNKLDILDNRTVRAINNADFANNRTIMLAQYINAEFHTEPEQSRPAKTTIRKIKKADENKAK